MFERDRHPDYQPHQLSKMAFGGSGDRHAYHRCDHAPDRPESGFYGKRQIGYDRRDDRPCHCPVGASNRVAPKIMAAQLDAKGGGETDWILSTICLST